jgi:hypothetical protein
MRAGWQPVSFDDKSFVLAAGPGRAGLDLNEEIPVFSLAQPFTAGKAGTTHLSPIYRASSLA